MSCPSSYESADQCTGRTKTEHHYSTLTPRGRSVRGRTRGRTYRHHKSESQSDSATPRGTLPCPISSHHLDLLNRSQRHRGRNADPTSPAIEPLADDEAETIVLKPRVFQHYPAGRQTHSNTRCTIDCGCQTVADPLPLKTLRHKRTHQDQAWKDPVGPDHTPSEAPSNRRHTVRFTNQFYRRGRVPAPSSACWLHA
jgi:hypothetical protein